ncbi:hypothetical protein BC938DRAFT_484327 [Jimgerdemannia flammicorona]|uniref:Pentacotripeptide-repeat region of PRORP domain-containing protein n=1 Tax=Jimgerdemannia flammicorona TaxID=994334 RepID=A0A433QV72_9FUNG|nr:hypothetical protein BC938DRAFT_484327 [Jimgerdemannia flammicorona]
MLLNPAARLRPLWTRSRLSFTVTTLPFLRPAMRSASPTCRFAPPCLTTKADNTFHHVQSSPVSMPLKTGFESVQLYAARMKQHLDNGNIAGVFAEYASLSSENIQPSLEVYHTFLKGCVANLNFSKAVEAVERLQADSRHASAVTPIQEIYSLLLKVASLDFHAVDDIAKVAEWFHDASRSPLPPEILSDIEAWNKILKASLKLGSSYRRNELVPLSYRTCLSRSVRKANGILRRIDQLEKYKRNLAEPQMPPSSQITELLALSFASAGFQAKSEEILRQAASQGYTPSNDFWYTLARNHAYQGNLPEVKQIADENVTRQNSDAIAVDAKSLFLPVLTLAHKVALEKYVIEFASEVGVTGLNRRLSRVEQRVQPLHDSYRELTGEISRADAALLGTQTYNLMIEYNILANRINHQQFPMSTTEDIFTEMQTRGLQLDFGTFFNLMRGYARTHEFDTRLGNVRLDKALQVLQRMENAGVNTNHQSIFQVLFEACLPHNAQYNSDNFHLRRKLSGVWAKPHNAQYNSDNFHLRRKLSGVWAKPLKTLYVDPRIFDIERIMRDSKVSHDRITLKTLFTCLGVSGQYHALWNRWREMQFKGIHRNVGLYQRIFALCSLDVDQARYALTVVRHQMARETPPVRISWGIYESLLDCCIASQDVVTAREVIEAMKVDIFPANKQLHADSRKVWPHDDSPLFYTPLIRACFLIRGLENEGFRLLEEAAQRDVKYDNFLWTEVISYLVHAGVDHGKVQEIFNEFVMSRFERTAKIPIPVAECAPIVPFPSGPYTTTDTRIIDLYLTSLLRSQNLSVLRDVFATYAEQSQELYVTRDTVRGFIDLAINERNVEDAKWFINEVAPRVAGKTTSYRKWLSMQQMKLNQHNAVVKTLDPCRILPH